MDFISENIIYSSKHMHEILATVRKVANFKTTVLISGESGTGKELIAKALHYHSNRQNEQFVTINCGAIPENLLESEFFGHIKGSFTGAHRDKKGLFEEANNGTLFLDEIAELPLLLQVKLLRVLQEEKIRRVGDNIFIPINVRIITATLKNLNDEVKKGTFREDLYYRINVLPIHIEPLRERKEDLKTLIEKFIEKFNKKLSLNIADVEKTAMDILINYEWYGNIRELENTIERAMILATTNKLTIKEIPVKIIEFKKEDEEVTNNEELSIKKQSKKLEEGLIIKALKVTHGNKSKASNLLEISHRALLYKIKEYGINASERP